MAKLESSAWKKYYPFTSHYFTLQHPQPCRMHYLDEGEGAPIILLHGNPTWSFFYRNVILALKPQFRCLSPDHIGCGLSDKPYRYPYCLKQHIDNILQWLDSLHIDTFHLMVHDWGGAIGMGVATHMPERVKSLVILNSAAFLSQEIPWRISLCRFPLLGSWAIRYLNAFAKPATFMAVEQPLPKAIKQGYLFPYDTPKHRIAIDRFVQDIPMKPSHPTYATLKWIQEHLYALKNHPCLLAWGMKDFCFTPNFLKTWQGYFPQAEVHKFEHAGHYVLEDAQNEIGPMVKNFLQRQNLLER